MWTLLGSVFGGGLGFIVANFPGLVAGGVIGSGLGAVRDAKGKAVLAAYNELNAQQRAEVGYSVIRGYELATEYPSPLGPAWSGDSNGNSRLCDLISSLIPLSYHLSCENGIIIF